MCSSAGTQRWSLPQLAQPTQIWRPNLPRFPHSPGLAGAQAPQDPSCCGRSLLSTGPCLGAPRLLAPSERTPRRHLAAGALEPHLVPDLRRQEAFIFQCWSLHRCADTRRARSSAGRHSLRWPRGSLVGWRGAYHGESRSRTGGTPWTGLISTERSTKTGSSAGSTGAAFCDWWRWARRFPRSRASSPRVGRRRLRRRRAGSRQLRHPPRQFRRSSLRR